MMNQGGFNAASKEKMLIKLRYNPSRKIFVGFLKK